MGEEERAGGPPFGPGAHPLPFALQADGALRAWGNRVRNPSLLGPWALPHLPTLLFALHALRGWLLSVNSPSFVPVLRCS